MNRRVVLKQLSALAALSALAPASFAHAEEAGGGRFDTLRAPVPSETPGKVDVLEFFHYGCPHCRDFDPLLETWLKTVPTDVVVRRVPVIWNEQLRGLARLYYTIERTETLHTLHSKVFAAVQSERKPLHTEAGVAEWIKPFGVDEKVFMDTYKSFGVQSLVKRAEQIARNYSVNAVPTMAVGGRYVTSASRAGSHENALKVVDELIAKVRGEQAKG